MDNAWILTLIWGLVIIWRSSLISPLATFPSSCTNNWGQIVRNVRDAQVTFCTWVWTCAGWALKSAFSWTELERFELFHEPMLTTLATRAQPDQVYSTNHVFWKTGGFGTVWIQILMKINEANPGPPIKIDWVSWHQFNLGHASGHLYVWGQGIIFGSSTLEARWWSGGWSTSLASIDLVSGLRWWTAPRKSFLKNDLKSDRSTIHAKNTWWVKQLFSTDDWSINQTTIFFFWNALNNILRYLEAH